MERTTLTDDQGPVVSFIAGTRDNCPQADFTEMAPRRLIQDAAAALQVQCPGWYVSTPNGALAGELSARGASQIRHAHGMLAATGDHTVALHDIAPYDIAAYDIAAYDIAPYDIAPFADVPWAVILPSWKAAYPPGHPDHEMGDDHSLIETHLRPYADLGALGPTHRSSGIVLIAGQVAAGIIISLRPEPAPFGGPWVTEVWRDPAPKFRGIGALLLKRTLGMLHEDGHATLGLAVSHANPARRVYKALGFTETSESWTLRLPWDVDECEG